MSKNWYLLVLLGIILLVIGIIYSEICYGDNTKYVCNNQEKK